MLALAAIMLLAAGIAVFWVTLRAGVYRRVPYELYLLLSFALGVGLYAWIRDPSWLKAPPFIIAGLGLGILLWYTHFGSAFPRSELGIEVGDRFPVFSLPDSNGETVASRDLIGKSSALYLFYRGDW
jgi:hypothetical protein